MARRILVPLDGSIGGEAVLAEVAVLARAEGAVVRLLRVAPPPRAVEVDGRIVAYADQEATRIAQEIRDYLGAAATVLSDLEVEHAIRFGEPGAEIVAEAHEAGADLIAMATHGRAGVGRVIHGSVAEQVLRTAGIPVLFVAHGEREDAEDAPRHGRVTRSRFWCAWAERDVEVRFEEQGVPGFRRVTAIRSCSALDPPTPVTCQRRCLDPAYRLQWAPVAPPERLRR